MPNLTTLDAGKTADVINFASMAQKRFCAGDDGVTNTADTYTMVEGRNERKDEGSTSEIMRE